MYKAICKTALLFSMTLLPLLSHAEIAVIVHPSNGNSISQTDVERIYLAKVKSFADGTAAVPLNHEESTPTRVAFDNDAVGKSESQMKSYWAKLLFTGKATPIKQLASDAEMISAVSSTPGAIGYVDAASVNDSVKVVLSF